MVDLWAAKNTQTNRLYLFEGHDDEFSLAKTKDEVKELIECVFSPENKEHIDIVKVKLIESDPLIKFWKREFFHYYEDFESNKNKAQAYMAVFLISEFLKDLGVDKITVSRVDYYNYNIDWEKFEEHVGLPVKIESKDSE